MGSVEVTPISLPRDIPRFVKTWFPIYENEPHWVPPLLFERKRFFDPGINPYFKAAQVQCFVATLDGHDVGTIAAAVDTNYQSHDPGAGFFGFFEFIDDAAVADALFSSAREWLIEKGMKKAIGPFNFNTNHEFGLLVDGFDHDPFVLNPYNAAYYPAIYESLGLRKAMDWYAYRVDAEMPGFKKIRRVGERILARNPNINVRPLDLSSYAAEVDRLHAIYDGAWEQNWAHVRVTDEEFDFLAEGLKQIIDPDLCFVVEIEGRTVGMSVTIPDLNQAIKKTRGRLFPFGWIHLLFRKRHIDRVRIFMLGIDPEFQHLPLGAVLYARTFNVAVKKNLTTGEASLILENNIRMRGALEKMGGVVEKTYRNYEMDFIENGTGESRDEPELEEEGAV
jgi:GNAT superfamily N-acetyltransferase